jgi:hypothetical protein
VTLLYCFFATPTSQWKASYKSVDVLDAIRACSSTLAILAERWIEAECVRDVFEILAREIPLGQAWERPTAMREAGRLGIQQNWNNMSKIVIHRPTLRMIQEMATEEYVSDGAEEDGSGAMRTANATGTAQSTSNFVHDMDLQWTDATNPQLELYSNFDSAANVEVMPDSTYFHI